MPETEVKYINGRTLCDITARSKNVPDGGTAGQVLKRNSEGAAVWEDESGGGSDNVFWAVYGETTYSEINQALEDGKIVKCLYDGKEYLYYWTSLTSWNVHHFFNLSRAAGVVISTVEIYSNDEWYDLNIPLESSANKVNSISSSSNNNHYPSAKAVYDALVLKQDILTFDNTPTANSNNPVKSSGLKTAFDNVTAVANGKTACYVFNTVSELETWLSDSSHTSTLHVGDVFLIRAIDVPDYWWDGTAKQQLETTKIDLTDYATKAELNSGLSAKQNVIDSSHKLPYSNISGTPTIPTSLPANGGNSDTVDGWNIAKKTQAQYNALTSAEKANTIFFIVG